MLLVWSWSYCYPSSRAYSLQNLLITSGTLCKKLQNKRGAWQGWQERLAPRLALPPCQLPFKLNFNIYDDRSRLVKQSQKSTLDNASLLCALWSVYCEACGLTTRVTKLWHVLPALGDIKIDKKITMVVRFGKSSVDRSNSLHSSVYNTVLWRDLWQ